MRKGILALVVATIACLLTATTASAQAPAPKVLVFHGTPDATVNAGLAAIEALGTNNGFDVDDTANAGDFTAANLAQYRAIVVLGNSGNDALNAAHFCDLDRPMARSAWRNSSGIPLSERWRAPSSCVCLPRNGR